MDSQKIKAVLIVFIAAIAALYLGVAAATEQVAAIGWMVAGLGLVFVLALGKNIWLLIASGVVLNGGMNFLPGSPPPWWLAMFATCGVFLLRFALTRGREFTWRWNSMDFVVMLHIVMLLQAYYRNPVGLSVFGGSGGMVGGKPYLAHAFAICCYVLLGMVKTDIRMFRVAAIVMISSALFDSVGVLVGSFIPAVAAIGIKFYSGFSFTAAMTGVGANVMEGRTVEGKDVGESLGQAVFSLFRPITAANPRNVLPFVMLLLAVFTIMISGYRSVMGMLVIYFVVGSLVRGKAMDIVFATMAAVLGLCILIFVGTDKLPTAGQRILSVIPIEGLVDERIAETAEKSTEWRVEMWRLALTTDRYIFNKMWGDGFGMRKDEMDAMIESAHGDSRFSRNLDPQEVLMRRGSYHGFHVQTIRMTGYVGLLLVLLLLFVFLRHAWSHIKYFKGRPEWGYVLFVCIPFLIFPFYAMLVFGDYRTGLPRYIIMAGFLKMLWNIRRQEQLHQFNKEPREHLLGEGEVIDVTRGYRRLPGPNN